MFTPSNITIAVAAVFLLFAVFVLYIIYYRISPQDCLNILGLEDGISASTIARNLGRVIGFPVSPKEVSKVLKYLEDEGLIEERKFFNGFDDVPAFYLTKEGRKHTPDKSPLQS